VYIPSVGASSGWRDTISCVGIAEKKGVMRMADSGKLLENSEAIDEAKRVAELWIQADDFAKVYNAGSGNYIKKQQQDDIMQSWRDLGQIDGWYTTAGKSMSGRMKNEPQIDLKLAFDKDGSAQFNYHIPVRQ